LEIILSENLTLLQLLTSGTSFALSLSLSLSPHFFRFTIGVSSSKTTPSDGGWVHNQFSFKKPKNEKVKSETETDRRKEQH
jgi:hypothetical protein